MPDNRFVCSGAGNSRDTVCIEANRVLDSCRDRDCYENIQVFLTNYGNEIIERTGNIRVKHSCIAWSNITVDPIAFNKGFYSVNIRLYIKILFEACLAPGRIQEFDGVAVVDKNVVLFGGERNVPTAVVEVVDPIILNARIIEKRHEHHCTCCCSCTDVPEHVTRTVNGQLCDDGNRFLVVSIGIFSVVRIVRPAQYLIQATEYTVPDKECLSRSEENPCEIFKCMEFPIDEFTMGSGPTIRQMNHNDKGCSCK